MRRRVRVAAGVLVRESPAATDDGRVGDARNDAGLSPRDNWCMAKKPITPGQKAAKARDRERFAAKLATNEAEADWVHERLLEGLTLSRRNDGETYAFPDGTEVDAAIASILRHRKVAMPRGDALVGCTPAEYAAAAVAADKAASKRKAARLDRWMRALQAAGDDRQACHRVLEEIADEAMRLSSIDD